MLPIEYLDWYLWLKFHFNSSVTWETFSLNWQICFLNWKIILPEIIMFFLKICSSFPNLKVAGELGQMSWLWDEPSLS